MHYPTIDRFQKHEVSSSAMTTKALKRQSMMISRFDLSQPHDIVTSQCQGCFQTIRAEDSLVIHHHVEDPYQPQRWHETCFHIYSAFGLKAKREVPLESSMKWIKDVFGIMDAFHRSILDYQDVIRNHILNEEYKEVISRSRTLTKQIEALLLLRNSIRSDTMSGFDIPNSNSKLRSKSFSTVRDMMVEYVHICRILEKGPSLPQRLTDLSQKAVILLDSMPRPIYTLVQEGVAWMLRQSRELSKPESALKGHLHRIKALTCSPKSVSNQNNDVRPNKEQRSSYIGQESRMPTPPPLSDGESATTQSPSTSTVKIQQTQQGAPYLSFAWNESSDEESEKRRLAKDMHETDGKYENRRARPSAIRISSSEQQIFRDPNSYNNSRKEDMRETATQSNAPSFRQPTIIANEKSPFLKFLFYMDNLTETETGSSIEQTRHSDADKNSNLWFLDDTDDRGPKKSRTPSTRTASADQTLEQIQLSIAGIQREIKALERCQYFIHKGRYDLFYENIHPSMPSQSLRS